MKSVPLLKKYKFKITGTHCASCEILIERQWKKIHGISKVQVDYATGNAKVWCDQQPDLALLDSAIRKDGYSVRKYEDTPACSLPTGNTARDYAEIGAILLIVVALYVALKQFDILPKSLSINDNMSYGFIFMIGLVAAVSSCIAVTGGLLLAVAGKYNESHPNLTGWQKFRPHMYFNIGRVISYTVLGALVGTLGSVLTISPRVNGVFTVLVSLVMLSLGFQLLKLPWLKKVLPGMPKWLSHKVHDLSTSDSKAAPFFLGAGTFFLPCGFTQALQLYVLSKGDPWVGGLTMLAFSLGTLPALASLGALSSFIKGAFQSYFLKFAGVVVVILGIFNINNGLALAGSPVTFNSFLKKSAAVAASSDLAPMVNGVQVVDMKVVGLSYTPSRFKVRAGIPVEWRVDGSGAAGCAQVISAPSINVTEYLSKGVKSIRFTPKSVGKISFSCSMGMTTPGAAFIVVESDEKVSVPEGGAGEVAALNSASVCDPTITNCIEPTVQKVAMEISNEKGFYPNEFTVKKGQPVEWTIDDQVELGGCMGTILIPKFDSATRLSLGTNVIKFTPTETGEAPFVCSMGNYLGRFVVTD